MLFVAERRRNRRLPSAIRARDVRAADMQEEPTKPVEIRADFSRDRFVGFDEDGGSTANIAASEASHQAQRAQRAEQSTQRQRPGRRCITTSTDPGSQPGIPNVNM